MMQMTGTGALSGFNRSITVPLSGFNNNLFIFAPRAAFAPVQTAAALCNWLNGQVVGVGDPDFDLLRILGGYNYGMPSPGQIQLVSTGSGWAVSKLFRYHAPYRIHRRTRRSVGRQVRQQHPAAAL
ncbi:MAG: hypothetical protein IPI48_17820 [bacterium]|nr:hypothetical protein [bacterium]